MPKQKWSQEQLIENMQTAAKLLNRTPSALEAQKRTVPGLASYSTFVLKFGSWSNALAAAGLEPRGMNSGHKKSPPAPPSPPQDPLEAPKRASEAQKAPAPKAPPSPPPKAPEPTNPQSFYIVNLFAVPVVIKTAYGTYGPIESDGAVMVAPFYGNADWRNAPVKNLRKTLGAPITVRSFRWRIRVKVGTKYSDFPQPRAGVFYLVPHDIALALRANGRTTDDIVFPIGRKHRPDDGVITCEYIAMLE